MNAKAMEIEFVWGSTSFASIFIIYELKMKMQHNFVAVFVVVVSVVLFYFIFLHIIYFFLSPVYSLKSLSKANENLLQNPKWMDVVG